MSAATVYNYLITSSAGPAGSSIGTASVAGTTWTLFQGTVETWTVFSFVAPSEITNFSADVKEFFSTPYSQIFVAFLVLTSFHSLLE